MPIAPQKHTRARGRSGISQNSAAFAQRFGGVYRCSAACCRRQRKLLFVSTSLVLLLLLRQLLVTAPNRAGALRFGRHGQIRNRGAASEGVACQDQLLKVKCFSLSGFVMPMGRTVCCTVLLASTQSLALLRRR